MKLPDFRENNWMNNLRALIWANLNTDYDSNIVWDPLVVKLIDEWELWNLSLKDVSVSEDWTLEYGWMKVVVYIRDQYERWFEKWYKFHFYNCQTLESFKSDWKYDWKYVVNQKWKFKVNLVNFWFLIQENIEVDLHVCKNCLKEFNYRWYADALFVDNKKYIKILLEMNILHLLNQKL